MLNNYEKKRRIAVRYIDQPLLLAMCSLLSLGFVLVTSASLHIGVKVLNDISNFPLKQLAHIILGLGFGAAAAQIEMRTWEKLGPRLFIAGLILLVMVLVPHIGVRVNGSARWLSLFGIRVQASEVMKFIAVIYIAGYINRKYDYVRRSHFALFAPLFWCFLAGVLLLLEPDFGSVVVIMVIAMSMMYLAGARLPQFVVLSGVGAAAGGMLILHSSYRMARVLSFRNPWEDAQNSGFQLSQALIAFGRGEFTGVGLGNGLQKLFYLPEAHTDFLFSVLGEEMGLVGVLAVIGLFTVFSLRAIWIGEQAEKAGQRFSSLVAYGLAVWFGFQAFVNMGVNMGMLPTKGLTLPLMSYGGGSMIVMCISAAVLFRIHYETAAQGKNSAEGTA